MVAGSKFWKLASNALMRPANSLSFFRPAYHFARGKYERSVRRQLQNWYEGGWPIWTGGNISYVPSLVQDSRWDQNFVTRREMLRRMRYWSQNSGLVEAILSVGERFTVGSEGLHACIYPANDQADEEDTWYGRAEQFLKEWDSDCGWNGETMAELLSIAYRCQKVDGDVFLVRTRKRGQLTMVDADGNEHKFQVFKPCIQIVEGHRVETPWTQFDDYNLIDGVQFEVVKAGEGKEKRDLLQVVGYWMRNAMGSFEQHDSWNLIAKEHCWHMRNLHRANQPRSVSDFYSVEVDLHKLEDIIEIEMKAQVSQSERALAVKSQSGQATSPLDPKLEAVRVRYGTQPQPPNQTDQNLARWEMYRQTTGARVIGLKLNEDIVNLAPNRPSESTLQLFEFTTNRICSGTKSPRTLVFNAISGQSARPQGTQVRAELDSADKYYKGEFGKWKKFRVESAIWALEWGIKNDQRLADPPADWRSCIHVQRPAACNVDPGYTAQSDVMYLAAGLKDPDMIVGPWGASASEIVRKLGRWQKMVEKAGIKISLPALLSGQIPLDGKNPKQEEVEA